MKTQYDYLIPILGILAVCQLLSGAFLMIQWQEIARGKFESDMITIISVASIVVGLCLTTISFILYTELRDLNKRQNALHELNEEREKYKAATETFKNLQKTKIIV